KLINIISIIEKDTISLLGKFFQDKNQENLKGIELPYSVLRKIDSYFRSLPINNLVNNHSPTKKLWEAEIRDFLCWQSFRIWQDHLYFLNLNSKNYYTSAIEIIFNDIKKFKGPSDLTSLANSLIEKTDLSLERNSQPEEMITGLVKEIPWTYESTRIVSIFPKVADTKLKPSGKINVWAELNGNLDVVDEQALDGVLLKINEKQQQILHWDLNLKLKDQTLLKENEEDFSQINFQGFFRGKRLELKVPLEIRNRPSIKVIEKIPKLNASLAIRTNLDFNKNLQSTGAVVFVLDCSGSMGLPPGMSDFKESKYYQAIVGLEKVLNALPSGLQVSVWVFGQAIGDGKSTNDPESNIRQIISPIKWDSSNKQMIGSIVSQLQYPKIQPWNSSPIIRSIYHAIEDIKYAEGSKFLIAFTDGLDNRIHLDKKINPNSQSASAVLFSTLNGTGIQSQIISFKAIESEEVEMRRQFSSIEQLDPPGYFVKADNIEEVVGKIDKFLNPQIKIQINDLYNRPVKGINSNLLDITPFGNGDKWFLDGFKSGYYSVRLSNDPGVQSIIKVDDNDRLLLQLKNSGNNSSLKPFFEKYNWAKNDYSKRMAIEKNGWYSSILSSKLNRKDYSFLVSLDKLSVKDESPLSQIKPREIWWEFESKDQKNKSLTSTITKTYDYPANTWLIDCLDKQSDLKKSSFISPKLSAWWTINQEVPFTVKLFKGSDYDSWADLEGKYIDIDGRKIRIKSCSSDSFQIKSESGEFKTEKCFIIAINHPIDFPLVLKTEGMENFHKESHFYRGAGQTSFVFYPSGLIPPIPASLHFIPVNRIKQNALSNGLFIEYESCPVPDLLDVLPDPIILSQ
ncbi:MAG: hypothetical protein ACK5E4_14390, partial [Planctomycetia bacterium]